ncbi:Gfo/Idh/MocA family protein [Demequina iriomotensis]|uniref:Gfo/Idh/MocA family protein n=1 Tax=Demequina iriomotensis TaxID=1536641 RepID=UPI000786345F|nr:Gfo/Idh/MocA family oxidoreductase [Demequina iriomotensis]
MTDDLLHLEPETPYAPPPKRPVDVVIVGCGAVTTEYQGPAAQQAARSGHIRVVGLVDTSAERLARAGRLFPDAETFASVDAAPVTDLALVATPAATHADLACGLLESGASVLVEKPLASTAEHGRRILATAAEHERVVAVGHFRRFFPALRAVQELVRSERFGPVRGIDAREGGLFRWTAASTSFFDRSLGGGGVTLDIGVHLLEVLISWLGTPVVEEYADDAMGGVEINSRARLRWAGGAEGRVALSWDVPLANRYVVRFEHATVTWRAGQATEVMLDLDGVSGPLAVSPRVRIGRATERSAPTHDHLGAFTAQWIDVANAVANGGRPYVDPAGALATLETIESMYAMKRLMPLPYLEPDEAAAARARAEGALR